MNGLEITNVRSSISRTAITLKFKISRLLEKRKTTTTTTTTKAKENRLKRLFQANDSKKCNQRQNRLSTHASIRLNFVRLQIEHLAQFQYS